MLNNAGFIIGNVTVSDVLVPQVNTTLDLSDILGAVKVRWGFNRDRYRVSPGLYATGSPGPDSDVFVTSNYKLTFDHVRKSLSGIDGWILVLDTKGVNVWCAAGKGTFGTRELVKRIRETSLEKIVNHRRIIVPQLGATGIAAHKVKEETGFNVHYGPVRAGDIKEFIQKGYRATVEMRKVSFGFADRVRLIPNDLMYNKFWFLGTLALLLALSGISKDGYGLAKLLDNSLHILLYVFLAYASGIIITPALLPYIPGRHFALKGILAGGFAYGIVLLFSSYRFNIFETLSWFFIMTSVSSFLAMNFTGSSTFTSLSGVKKEMKIFIPVQITFASAGLILNLIGKFTG